MASPSEASDLRSVYPYCSVRSAASTARTRQPRRSSRRRFSKRASVLLSCDIYYVIHSMWHTCQVCQEQKRGYRSQATGNREPKPKVKTFTTEDTKDTEVSDLLTVYRLTYRVSDGE